MVILLKGVEIMNIYTPLKVREKHFVDELNKKIPSLEYISGYNGSESKVLLKCKKCGSDFERTASIIRNPHYKKFKCNKCYKINKQINNFINKRIKEFNKATLRETEKVNKWLHKNTLYIRQCKYCAKEIISDSKYKEVCDKCRVKKDKHSYKSLKKLYKRDKGICHICNGKCNYKDYIVKNNTIICGDSYPSIDHIIPIAKGGTD